MSEWVSVKDDLPNEGDIVLCCGIGEPRIFTETAVFVNFPPSFLVCEDYRETDYGVGIESSLPIIKRKYTIEITHWQSLPFPPNTKG